jgi:uncharacterized protein YbgA (DUF1722 family)/uncharacterized protein YbbK (DUF523 family)
MTQKIRLGVSACLLGQNVRYDGQHKLDHFITDTLGRYVDYVPVCPEVECGFGVPRESMRLVGNPEDPRLITTRTKVDKTEPMVTWARKRVEELTSENLCGFIFKSDSPSSGMERVKVYSEKGMVCGRSPGLFAREFLRFFPLLPAEEEGRLHDPDLRENFIERIFALNRYREEMARKPAVATLMQFHARHKLLIMAHHAGAVTEMGRLLARARPADLPAVRAAYEALLLQTLKRLATPAKHVNVLQHMLGYFRDTLTSAEKQEMLAILESFKRGDVPLIVPVTMMKHYVNKFQVAYLAEQVYLDPHPLELKLRNHA